MSPVRVHTTQSPLQQNLLDKCTGNNTYHDSEALGIKEHVREILNYADGSKYEGECENGEKSGFGTQTLVNGKVLYEGEWSSNVYHGSGNLFNPSSEKASTDFNYSNFDSLGNSWEKYEGDFENGQWHGLGTLHLTSGEKFVGKFRNGLVHGKGIFYQSNGKIVPGEWNDNKFVGAL